MKNIKDYNLEELKQELINMGEKPFSPFRRKTKEIQSHNYFAIPFLGWTSAVSCCQLSLDTNALIL